MTSNLLLDTKEILRYMGISLQKADSRILSLIEECKKEIENYLQPRYALLRFPLQINQNNITISDLTFYSSDLAKNLSSCEEVYMFAATIGPQVDMMIKRYQKLNMAKSVVFNAVAITAIEAYCDFINDQIKNQAALEGKKLKPRYSPGYGDCPLEVQKPFLKLLNAERLCGIVLSEGDLMIPEKSVTAFAGIYK